MSNNLLAGFITVIRAPIAWGDMDAYGHANNTVYFHLFESARIAFLDEIDFRLPDHNDGVGPILKSTSCTFRSALTYPDTVEVGARVTDLARDRFTMEYRIIRTRDGALAAEGEGVVVGYDYRRLQKAELPAVIHGRIRERMPAVSDGAGAAQGQDAAQERPAK